MLDNRYSDVFCIIQEEEKYNALEEIISSCSIFLRLPERLDKFTESVIEREKLQSTDIGHGVAITHGKVAYLEKTIIALGYSKTGIVFKEGGEPVHLIFVIASPLSSDSDYLQSVSSLLSWVHDMNFRAELEECKLTDNVKAFFDMLQSQSFKSIKILSNDNLI